MHWRPAVVLEKPTGKRDGTWRVGLSDGRILPLAIDNAAAQRKLTLYDGVLTRVGDARGNGDAHALACRDSSITFATCSSAFDGMHPR